MPIDDETVDSDIADEAIEIQRPHVVAVRPSCQSNVMLHLDTLSIQLGATHAREHVESLEDMRSGSLVEMTLTRSLQWITDTWSLMARKMTMKMTNFEQRKWLILLAKDVQTGTYAATCLQEKGVSEYATAWPVSMVRRLGYRRAKLRSDWRAIHCSSQKCNFVGSSVCRVGFV